MRVILAVGTLADWFFNSIFLYRVLHIYSLWQVFPIMKKSHFYIVSYTIFSLFLFIHWLYCIIIMIINIYLVKEDGYGWKRQVFCNNEEISFLFFYIVSYTIFSLFLLIHWLHCIIIMIINIYIVKEDGYSWKRQVFRNEEIWIQKSSFTRESLPVKNAPSHIWLESSRLSYCNSCFVHETLQPASHSFCLLQSMLIN